MTRLRLLELAARPRTTALIQPAFYADLPFTSVRSPRHVEPSGTVLPELSIRPVTPLAGPGDPYLAAAAANRARELPTAGVVVDHGQNRRPLDPLDVAVISL